MDGWMDGSKMVLRIAYSNQKVNVAIGGKRVYIERKINNKE